MAKKRLKKKQQAKQNLQKLSSVGVPKKEAKRIKNKPEAVKKVYKKEKRKKTANERSTFIQRVLGEKVSDHSSKRYWSEERWNEWSKQQLEQKKKRDKEEERKRKRREYQREYRKRKKAQQKASPLKMVMLWKDRTEFIDDTTLQMVKESGYGEDLQTLVTNINTARQYNGGEIGDYKIEISDNPNEVISYYRGEYYPIYVGNGTRYKQLLIAVGAMLAGIYYPFEKEIFLMEVASMLNIINPKAAARFVNDFQLY
jgi:hypothetical protein